MAVPAAAIMIVTRNRKDKARKAIESALALAEDCDVEVIVIDDASTDGTSADLVPAFPQVRFARSDVQKGLIVQRNVAVGSSTAPVIISLDDDAVFADPQTVREAIALFQEPRVGAVAIPFTNFSPDGKQQRMLPSIPDDGAIYVSNTFVGTAFAVRREVFQRIGGFQGVLFHWGEESDYSQRLLGAGYVVAMAKRGMIHHYPNAPGKYIRQVNRYIYRNALLSIWFNAPALMLIPLVLGQLARFAVEAVRRPLQIRTIVEGIGMAVATAMRSRNLRKPIPLATYRLWMRIRRERPVPLDRVRAVLPALV